MSQITCFSILSESENASSNSALAEKVDKSSMICTDECRSAEPTKLFTPVVEVKVEEEPEEQNNENQSNKASRKSTLPATPKVVSLAELIHQCSPLSDGSDENQNENPKASAKVSFPVRPDGRTRIHSSQINDWIKEIVANFYNRFVASRKQINQSAQINESVHKEEIVEQFPFLLPPIPKDHKLQKKCLVLDLDETLIHSFASYTPLADFVMKIELDEGVFHPIYVVKRPGVDEFLKKCSEHFEIIVFTASLSKYANPLLDYLDPTHTLIKHRLFREHCVHNYGSYVKDLSLLGRPLSQTIIVDNSPRAYAFHYRNAIPCSSFFDNTNDMELYDIMDFLYEVHDVDDARAHLGRWRDKMNRY